MGEKTKLRVIQILCIVSLLITVFSIQKTYAKYFEQVNTTYATNIKRWIIKVNNSIVREKESLSQIMTPVFRPNEHMNNNNNTLIPGREGYFQFDIDYSKVDVGFKFDFDLKQVGENKLTDFQIYGYSIVETDSDSGEETETITKIDTLNDMTKLTQVIDLTEENDTDKTKTIRILFRWYDSDGNTMANDVDTQLAGEELKYKIKITFTQKL